MGVASDIEPRTSMERHLMDRDREGQLYLETRRQQAAIDLLKNRSSLLSTITPPSSNPSSAASSLFREPTGSSSSSSSSLPSSTQQQQSQQQPPSNSTVPNTPTSPLTNMSPAAAATTIHTQSQSQSSQLQAHLGRPQGAVQGRRQAGASSLAISSSTPYPYTTPPSSSAHTSTRTTTNNNTTTTVLPLAPPLLNIMPPNNKKTRQRSATTGPGHGRGERGDNFKGIPDRSLLPISPSSLEYQLTANLLNYPHPAAAANTSSSSSTVQSRPRSRSHSKSRLQQPLQQQPQSPLPAVTTTRARRHTVNKDARIDTTFFAPTSRGTGHRQQQHHHKHNDSNGSNGSSGTTTTTTTNSNKSSKNNDRYNNGKSVQPMTPQEWTPTSLLGSYPPSPTAACALGPSSTSDNPYFTTSSTTTTLTTPPTEPKLVSIPLPPIPPSPPLPPLPPKSPQTLIAQYFPRSLAPPPSRDRVLYGQRGPIVAPTPFKTPTFGPALISPSLASTTTHPEAPPLPPPSASFQYIPTADVSRVSTSNAPQSSQHHQHLFTEDNSSDYSSSSNRPSPNASVIGFQGSAAPTPPPPRIMSHQQHPARLPSDLDLILHNSRQRSSRLACSNSTVNKQGTSSVSSSEGSGPVNSLDEIAAPGPLVPTAPVLLFAPLRPRSPAVGAAGIRATPSTTSLSNPPIPPSPTTLPTTPIYPRGLSSPSILGDNAQVIIRLHQKPVPYIRELVPGKETGLAAFTATTTTTTTAAAGAGEGASSTVAFVTTPPSQPASTNTSRDLEMILDEITGRLRTNRTSMDPWAYHLSPWDDKPLPPVRRERGSRYWVFRDQDGLVPGPILFLAGHLFPPLWWVGALYPRLEHPDDVAALEAEAARAAEMEAYSVAARVASAGSAQTVEGQEDDARDQQNGVALQWLQRQLKTLGVTVASITLSSSSSSRPQPESNSSDDGNSTIATLQISQVPPSSGDNNEREGSTLANISTIHVPYQPPAPMPPSILDSRGPWAAREDSSRASSLFEQRMAHDRKVLRYELDLRWRRINLLWSFASLLLAMCLVAIVLGVRK